ncbi:MAG TPA: glycosyltransferase 87 family protein [Nocardioidaceae bacterium]|nr:glycosyltransferase 87 family protein [Nocardioidaceae bacterium]
MAYLGRQRAGGDVVAPTLDDPVARAASGAVGGPLGRHALTGMSWWTPLRVIIVVATVFFGLGVVQKSPCVTTAWDEHPSPFSFSHLCYSDIQYLYVGRGLDRGVIPFEPADDMPVAIRPTTLEGFQKLTIEYPVLSGLWMGGAAVITSWIGGTPPGGDVPNSPVATQLKGEYRSAVFWSVNAVGFFFVLLIALAFLVNAQRRRPWDALFVAASPCLALAAMINWDVLALGLVAAFLWSWSTRRPVSAGIFIGLGTATKLFPLFFLGPLLVLCLRERQMTEWTKTFTAAVVAWTVVDLPIYVWSPDAFKWFWEFNASRGPDYGSLWLVVSNYSPSHTASPHTVNVTTWIVFGAACAAIALLGLLAPRRPRLPQLLYLTVVAFLIVNKVYSPQYVIWLLPLAALARPRWRDLLIWQAAEIFYFFAIWMHIANFFVASGAQDWVYALAVVLRILAELYIAALIVRDILQPWRDPVRADGLSDDPVGGLLDEGIDAELDPEHDVEHEDLPPPRHLDPAPA